MSDVVLWPLVFLVCFSWKRGGGVRMVLLAEMVEYFLFSFFYYKAKSVLQVHHGWMLVLQSQSEDTFNVLIVVHFLQAGRKCHKQELPFLNPTLTYIQGLHSLWNCGKNAIRFSRPWGLWKFVNFGVFRALGKNYQPISQKLHFPRLNSTF